MSSLENVKIALGYGCILAYVIPLLYYSDPYVTEFNFIDFCYAVGTSLGIGAYLIIDSYKFKRVSDYYIISAGIFLVVLSFIFAYDSIFDRHFKTYRYVIINVIITCICSLSLMYQHRRH